MILGNLGVSLVGTGEQQRNIHKLHVEMMKRNEEYEAGRLKVKLRRARINRSRRNSGNRIVA